MTLKLNDFVQSLNRRSDKAMVELTNPQGDSGLKTTGFWGRLFKRFKTDAEVNKNTLKAFCQSINDEKGYDAMNAVWKYLAEDRKEGKPLTAYKVRTALEIANKAEVERAESNRRALDNFFTEGPEAEYSLQHLIQTSLPPNVELDDGDLKVIYTLARDLFKDQGGKAIISPDVAYRKAEEKIRPILSFLHLETINELTMACQDGLTGTSPDGSNHPITPEDVTALRPLFISKGCGSFSQVQFTFKMMSYLSEQVFPAIQNAAGPTDMARVFSQLLAFSGQGDAFFPERPGLAVSMALQGMRSLGKISDETLSEVLNAVTKKKTGTDFYLAVSLLTGGDENETKRSATKMKTACDWLVDELDPILNPNPVRDNKSAVSLKENIPFDGLLDLYLNDVFEDGAPLEVELDKVIKASGCDSMVKDLGIDNKDILRLIGAIGLKSRYSQDEADMVKLSIARLPAMKRLQTDGGAFTPETIWRAVVGEDPPNDLNKGDLAGKITARWMGRYDAACKARDMNKDAALPFFLSAFNLGLDPWAALKSLEASNPVERNITIADFPYRIQDRPTEISRKKSDEKEVELANDLHRRGRNSTITVNGVTISLNPDDMDDPDERKKFLSGSLDGSAFRLLAANVMLMCGPDNKRLGQQIALFELLGPGGMGPMHFISRTLGGAGSEHASCDMTLVEAEDDKIHLIVRTPRGVNPATEFSWEVNPDGSYILGDFFLTYQ